MGEGETRGVEHLPAGRGQRRPRGFGKSRGGGSSPSVDPITDDGVAGVREMNPNLVCAPGLESKREERESRSPSAAGEVRPRRPARRHHRAAGAQVRVARERGVDRSGGGRYPPDEGVVSAADRTGGHVGHETTVRERSPGHEKKTGRIPIEAMDEPRARERNQRRVVGQKRVEQCPRRSARSRVDAQTRGLVEDEKIRILVDDVQGTGLGPVGPRNESGGNEEEKVLAAGNTVGGPPRATVDPDVPGAGKIAEPRA